MSKTIANIFGLKTPKIYAPKIPLGECSFPQLLLGVELEVERCDHDGDWYRDKLSRGFRVEQDGSLRGNAFEFISNPMMMGHLLSELQGFFQTTQFNQENYTDRTSVHVHVNMLDMTPEQLSTLCLVYSVFESILFQFVGHYRDTNIYCIPWAQCRYNYNMVQELIDNVGKPVSRWQKYTALNLVPLGNQGTVEFRHMHGTSDMNKLTTWINTLGSLVAYAQRTPLQELTETLKVLNDTSAYKKFYESVMGKYLPFTNVYEPLLYKGVVNAKYSLIGWDKFKVSAVLKPQPGSIEELLQARGLLREQGMDAALLARHAANAAAVPGQWPFVEQPAQEVPPAQLELLRNQWVPANRIRPVDNARVMREGAPIPRDPGRRVQMRVVPPVVVGGGDEVNVAAGQENGFEF